MVVFKLDLDTVSRTARMLGTFEEIYDETDVEFVNPFRKPLSNYLQKFNQTAAGESAAPRCRQWPDQVLYMMSKQPESSRPTILLSRAFSKVPLSM